MAVSTCFRLIREVQADHRILAGDFPLPVHPLPRALSRPGPAPMWFDLGDERIRLRNNLGYAIRLTSSLTPIAAAYRLRVLSVGLWAPDSSRTTADGGTFIRRATSTWVSPDVFRASMSC